LKIKIKAARAVCAAWLRIAALFFSQYAFKIFDFNKQVLRLLLKSSILTAALFFSQYAPKEKWLVKILQGF